MSVIGFSLQYVRLHILELSLQLHEALFFFDAYLFLIDAGDDGEIYVNHIKQILPAGFVDLDKVQHTVVSNGMMHTTVSSLTLQPAVWRW